MKKIGQKARLFIVTGGMLVGMTGLISSAIAANLFEGWTGELFAGINSSSGNTDKKSASISALAEKAWEKSTFTLKGSLFYSESDNKMDGQKWDALSKYSFDFGKENKWFNFYQVYVDHDYFADIDYRVTPTAGIGYHIADTEDFVWDADGGFGYRITRHRVNTAADDEVVTAVVHTFVKKKIFDNSFISEDLTAYPGLESGGGVIIRSKTAFTNPITESIDLEIKYIVDYDSEPAAGKSSTDKQLIAGVKYKF